MTEKAVLLFFLASLFLLWPLTSPHLVTDYFRRKYSARQLAFTLFQSLPFWQLLDIPSWKWPVSPFDAYAITVGWIFFFAGWILSCWAKLAMRTNWGKPGQHNFEVQKGLVDTGPFRFSRNPIYVGLLFTFIGYELILRSPLMLLAVPLFVLVTHAIAKEERLLERYFGKEYLRYKAQVPRFL
jgi:protein-S-isoprenylcysteine O-methyltransferase Ste14